MKLVNVIVFIIIACIITAVLISTITEKEHEDKYIRMQNRIDSLQRWGDSLNTIILELDTVSDRLAGEEVIVKEKLIYIQSKNHENIRAISCFNNAQLLQFFTNRTYADTSYFYSK